MRKLTILLLTALLVTLAACAQAAYPTAQALVDGLTARGLTPEVLEPDTDADQQVTVEIAGDGLKYTVRCVFDADLHCAAFRVWNLVDFNEADLAQACEICSELNYTYRFVTFYVDPTDHSVTAAFDVLLPSEEDSQPILMEAFDHMVSIIGKSNEALSSLIR